MNCFYIRPFLALLFTALAFPTVSWASAVSDCNSQDMEKIVRGCSILIRKNSKDLIALNNRAFAYAALGKGDLAMIDVNKLIQLQPKNVVAHHLRGSLYGEKGDYAKAVESFSEVIRLEPGKWPIAYNNRAQALSGLGDLKSALADLNVAIKIEPTNWYHFLERGKVHEQSGSYDLAVADFTKAISLDPKEASSYKARGNCLAKMGRHEEAKADLAQYEKLKN